MFFPLDCLKKRQLKKFSGKWPFFRTLACEPSKTAVFYLKAETQEKTRDFGLFREYEKVLQICNKFFIFYQILA
jgi:hypothetical protein